MTTLLNLDWRWKCRGSASLLSEAKNASWIFPLNHRANVLSSTAPRAPSSWHFYYFGMLVSTLRPPDDLNKTQRKIELVREFSQDVRWTFRVNDEGFYMFHVTLKSDIFLRSISFNYKRTLGKYAIGSQVWMTSSPGLFTNTYEGCLKGVEFSVQWKEEKLELLPKPENPSGDWASHHPMWCNGYNGRASHLQQIATDCRKQQ